MVFQSFFEIEGPELAPKEFGQFNRARNKAIFLLNSTDEKASYQQKKQLKIAIKRANKLEEIAYAKFDQERARAFGRGG